MNTQVQNRPTAAYILTLIGGIIGAIGSLVLISLGTFMHPYWGFAGAGFPLLFFAGIGSWGLISSILLIIFAIKLNANPVEHTKWGVLILVFSIIGVSSLLGLIGGILALIYKPIPYGAQPAYQQPYNQNYNTQSNYAQPASSQNATRFCPNCGRMVNENIKFCPYCGKQLA